MRIIKFQVSTYAIFDLLKALDNTRDEERHIEYGVTKEGCELFVWAIEHCDLELCSEPACTSEEECEQCELECYVMEVEND